MLFKINKHNSCSHYIVDTPGNISSKIQLTFDLINSEFTCYIEFQILLAQAL